MGNGGSLCFQCQAWLSGNFRCATLSSKIYNGKKRCFFFLLLVVKRSNVDNWLLPIFYPLLYVLLPLFFFFLLFSFPLTPITFFFSNSTFDFSALLWSALSTTNPLLFFFSSLKTVEKGFFLINTWNTRTEGELLHFSSLD